MSNLLESLRLHDDLMALRTGTALHTPHLETRVIDIDTSPLDVSHEACELTRWIAYCELHNKHGHYETRDEAHDALLFPWEWCDGCNDIESIVIAHDVVKRFPEDEDLTAHRLYRERKALRAG